MVQLRSFSLLMLGLGAPSIYASPVSSSASYGCQSLAAAYPSLVSFPSSADYTSLISTLWSETCLENSTCVFEPNTAKQVAGGIKILTDTKTKFAVRGGGHMPNPGAAAITNGVLIVMTALNSTKLLANNVAQVGPGLRWSNVYQWISTFNRFAIGGRYAPVGVPGLLLGGGINFFGSQFGWACNQVVNMEVVLASGQIVNANKTSNPDLFWALKGGSSNYGIVTRFDINTFPFTSVYGGITIYNNTYLGNFLDATGYYAVEGGGSSDNRTSVNPTLTYKVSDDTFQIYTIVSHLGSDPAPMSLANYTKIPSVFNDNSVRTTFEAFTSETISAAYSDRSKRQTFRSTSLKTGPESTLLTHNVFMETMKSMPGLKSVEGLMLSSTHQTITKSWIEAARATGGDPMDLDPSLGNFMPYLIGASWENEKDDAIVEQFYDACFKKIEAQARARGLYYNFKYLNDSPEEVRVFDTYGYGKSLTRMRSIAKAYDPTGVFQKLMPGGFKIFY